MSMFRSKHSGWTWDGKRTPFGGGGGDIFSGIGDTLASFDQNVLQPAEQYAVPAAGLALAAFTGGASLGLDAALVAGADATAAGLGYTSAAEAITAGAATAESLGLPAETTLADLTAVDGSASAGWAGTDAGQAAITSAGGTPPPPAPTPDTAPTPSPTTAPSSIPDTFGTAPATEPAVPKTPQALASQLGYSDPIAAIAGGVAPADLGLAQSGSTLGDILGYAKTGAQVVGGLSQLAGGVGKLAGGVGAIQAGQQMGKYAQQADPNAQYRSGYASQLYNLLQNPSTITTTPGYQFNLGQGLQALQAQQAAQGRLVSGGGLLQAQNFGQQYAQSNLQQQQQLLAQLSGATQSPATGASAQAGLTAGQLGGVLGGAQAIASGLGGVLNPLATLYANYNNPSPSVS